MAGNWIEYDGVSVLHHGGADLSGPDMNFVRKDVVEMWDEKWDIVHITRIAPSFPTVGFILFSKPHGYYVWISATGTARYFDPTTGKLGKTTKVNAKTRGIIREYEAKMKKTTKKTPAKKKTTKRRS